MQKGTRDLMALRWATRSMTSCTDAEASMAKPVWRTAITSEWSPKMERAWVERRARDMKDSGSNSRRSCMFGIMSRALGSGESSSQGSVARERERRPAGLLPTAWRLY